ncbi:MAG: 5'-methylthioadenosine/adenosylhomocysteine nucleosidase [Clostridia bacterium]|nr:5'-methylthioadenosine/adenosylhomocysteine nucleosidase [Clostridia bacterium]
MKLGIIAAMKIEAELIEAAMTDIVRETCGSIEFCLGKIGSTDIVLAVCGIGKVFAAICAQTMIVNYAPDAIINTGVGGTLTKKLSVGDVAVSSAMVQHDMDTSALGDPVGLISGPNIIEIPADAALAEKISAIVKDMGINTVTGTIATGDQFIAKQETKDRIVERFGAIACEMEGAAIGQVCFVNKVPFAVIRAISDDADSGACDDYPTFAKMAAKNSAKAVIELANA